MRARHALVLLACVALLGGASGHAAAQSARVRLDGSVESSAGLERFVSGNTVSTTVSYGSRYAPSLQGFVLDPRILTFSLAGSFTDETTDSERLGSDTMTLEPYQLNVAFLPQSRNSFSLQAGRTINETDFSATDVATIGTTSTTDRMALTWRYLGGPVLPETTAGLAREVVATEQQAGLGTSEGSTTRSTLSLRLHRPIGRFQPVLTYSAELLERDGADELAARELNVAEGGLVHRIRYEDRVRLTERLVLPISGEYSTDPDFKRADTTVTLMGPLSPTLDAASRVGYAWFETRTSSSHTMSTSGELVKRFTPDLVGTGVVNGSVIAGDGPLAWTSGATLALSAMPFTHLRTVTDYGLQLSDSGTSTSVFHRAHLGATSTVIPRHTLAADYFVSLSELAGRSFVSQTLNANVTSVMVPRTTVNAGGGIEQQSGIGERRRLNARLGASATPLDWLSLRGAGDAYTETSSGTGQAGEDRRGIGVEGEFTVKPFWWIDLGLSGRQALDDVRGEDRPGERVTQAVTASASVRWRAVALQTAAFLERDSYAEQTRRGLRGVLGYRFRVWTISGDWEWSEAVSGRGPERLDLERQRVMFRLSRPFGMRLF